MFAATSTFAMYNVDGGQRALIFGRFQNGLVGGARGEGTHFYIPWVQIPIIMDVRTRYTKLQADTGSKDLQTVHLVLRVMHPMEFICFPPSPLQSHSFILSFDLGSLQTRD